MPTHTPDSASPPWRYQFLVLALSPILIGYTIWRACKDGGWRYIKQRLGWYTKARKPRGTEEATATTQTDLWVHAASVGEVFTVLPLLNAWLQNNSDACVLLTTGTPTGAAVLQQQNLSRVHHQYLPVDFAGACKRFVAQNSARNAWIVETEIWPWLYAHCNRRHIALTIINGRLSARTSTQANGLLASSYRRSLHNVRILARSTKDYDRFLALGAQRKNLQVVGNLKYGGQSTLQSKAALLQGDYVLAASTHNDEEIRVALAWQKLQSATLLVIVPRHPERGDDIKRQMKALGLNASQRSKGESPQAGETVYLADTLGELQVWYEHAMGAFVGASLIPRGGHNMLEPARYACPTIVGPDTSNFEDVMELLRSDHAIAVGEDEHAVGRFLMSSAQAEPDLVVMGQRARKIAEKAQGTLAVYLDLLSQ